MPRLEKWDARFLELARHVASWSKDPSTQVGAVIVRPDRTIASMGYNGAPRGVFDDVEALQADREYKLAVTMHAEMNAILSAHERLGGCTLYVWPMPPCSHCAGAVIQSGITHVVAPEPGERWRGSCEIGLDLMKQAGIYPEWVDDMTAMRSKGLR